MTLTRREFIKHSGIAAGTLVVTSAAPLPAWAEEKGGKILTAGRWGAMNVEVKDGKIVSSTGALAKTIPNSLQSTAADQVHHGAYSASDGEKAISIIHCNRRKVVAKIPMYR